MTRVVVVDDHPVVRAGLVALLSASGVEVAGQASGKADALAVVGRERPDVVLMDLQLGDDDGADVIWELRRRDPAVRALVLTTFDTDADIVAAVEAGAMGYLLKDADPATLVAGVESAAKGRPVYAPSVAGRLAARIGGEPGTSLTERERDVVALLAVGMTNRQIAKRLFLSEATVKTHLVHVFDKLGVDNRTAAVAAARARGLLR
ncbi:response regulator [Nigerium massiliense]|uniref:response regulator n=1 Tax=Nigerium massiliense TaxID=1522317 RepID=UPI00058F92E4|nr:response regulator transcription factor [Nigerium massiliense]